MGDYIVLIISCIFVNNILLAQFLGNCPFFGTSKKMETAVGMAMAVIFVLVLSGAITWLIFTYLLVPWGLDYLRTIAFILVIAALVRRPRRSVGCVISCSISSIGAARISI